MATIEIVQQMVGDRGAVNRYAPAGSDQISLYNTETASGLTLAQLIQAVCLRTAAANEAQSVVKMNMMTANSTILADAASMMEKIVSGEVSWDSAKTFLVGTMGIQTSELPADLSTFDRRMQAAAALKTKMEGMSQQQQQDMIDVQTMVNRRDVAYSTSANMVSTIGTSMNTGAANFR